MQVDTLNMMMSEELNDKTQKPSPHSYIWSVQVKVRARYGVHHSLAIQQTSALATIITRMEEQLPCNNDHHHGASTILIKQ